MNSYVPKPPKRNFNPSLLLLKNPARNFPLTDTVSSSETISMEPYKRWCRTPSSTYLFICRITRSPVSAGHPCVNRMYDTLHSYCSWRNMRNDVSRTVENSRSWAKPADRLTDTNKISNYSNQMDR